MLIGHLGDEVKMHYFEGGGAIGRFPLATNETYTNKQTGEKITNTEWHNVVVRNKAAEICEKYLSKGDKVYVEGRLKTRQWQGEDGIARYSTEIQVQDFTFLSTKKESLANAQGAHAHDHEMSGTNMQQKDHANTSLEESDHEDDLPF